MFLQAGAFAPAAPAWLPPASIFFGVQLLLAWYFRRVVATTAGARTITGGERRVAVALLTVGYLALMTVFVRRYASVAALSLYLFFLAQTIEGAASLRFFAKVLGHLTSTGSSSGGLVATVVSRLLPRIKYRLLSLFVVVVAASAVVYVLTSGPVVASPLYDVALVYTVASFLIAALGVSYRLRDTPDVFDRTAKVGVVLCLAGANVYDYRTLAGEFLAFGVGMAGYTVGFWIAALVIVGAATSPAVAAIRRVTPF